jgi:two-component system, cell cycle response regulator
MAAYIARVLLFDANPARPIKFDAKLIARGYHLMRAENDAEVLAMASTEHPDVVIINTPPEGDETAVINAWQERKIPLILIGDRADVEAKARALKEGVADYLPHDYRDVELFARIGSLLRLNTMQEELDRRLDTAQQYGIKDTALVAPDVDVDDARIVIIGADKTDNKATAELVGEKRVQLCTTATHEAMADLVAKEIDALIINCDTPQSEFMIFCGDIRNNSRLYNLPILLVTEKDSFDNADQPYEMGVTDVVHKPVSADELRNRVDSLVSQQRYRFAMRRVYRDAMRPMTSDGLTGLFSHGFLHENLAKQLDEAKTWHKNLTVGFFDIKSLAQFNHDYGYVAGDLLIRQISTMITGLLRGEDMSARYGGDEFVVVLPETPPDVAEVALRRIASVIGSTEFAVANMTEPVPVYLQVGVASAQEDDTAETLIARAKTEVK